MNPSPPGAGRTATGSAYCNHSFSAENRSEALTAGTIFSYCDIGNLLIGGALHKKPTETPFCTKTQNPAQKSQNGRLGRPLFWDSSRPEGIDACASLYLGVAGGLARFRTYQKAYLAGFYFCGSADFHGRWGGRASWNFLLICQLQSNENIKQSERASRGHNGFITRDRDRDIIKTSTKIVFLYLHVPTEFIKYRDKILCIGKGLYVAWIKKYNDGLFWIIRKNLSDFRGLFHGKKAWMLAGNSLAVIGYWASPHSVGARRECFRPPRTIRG